MKNIIKSLFIVVAVAAVAGGVTWAVFSDTATVENNTFSTGTLELRINGQSSITGFTFAGAVPGDCKEGEFTVQNYGAPWFAGPSTLTAKELVLSSLQDSGDESLFNALKLKIENCAGPCETAFDGLLRNLNEENILMSWYSGGLIAGSSETIKYKVCLPEEAGNELQGKSVVFDFVADAYNPVRED